VVDKTAIADADGESEHHSPTGEHGEKSPAKKESRIKVKEFNKLRREMKKVRLKVRAEMSLTNRARNTLIVLIALIILLTVLFESMMDYILEATPLSLQPMVQSVFRELTLLGFISLFTFLAVKSTVPGKASRLIFGTPDELVEMFEIIHFVVFFFMLFFVVLVILLVIGGYRMKLWWDEAEKEAQPDHPMSTSGIDGIRNEYIKFLQNRHSGYAERTAKTKAYYQMVYLTMRNRFVTQVEAQDRTQSYATFEFAQYLAICHDTCVAAVVQVPSSAWVILLVGLGPLRAFIQIIDTKVKLAIFSSTGYILLLLSFVIYFKLKKIRFELIGVPDPDPSLVKKDAALFDKIVSTHTAVFDDVNHAPFTQTELQLTTYPRRSWWRVLFKVVNMPNKQQSLFWFDVAGPHFLFNCLRMLMLLTAVHSAMMVYKFSKFMIEIHPVIMVVSVLPVSVMSMWTFSMIASMLMQVTSVEMMKDLHAIKEVDMRTKTERMVKCLRLLRSMRLAQQYTADDSKLRSKIQRIPPQKRQELKSLFHYHDQTNCGYLSGLQVKQLLRSAGVENASLEQETDDDWSLAFDDLLILYADTVVPITAGKQSDPYTELIEAVFRQLDSDDSGSISLEEFVHAMRTQTDPQYMLSERECILLMREADSNQDGELDLAEFTELMTKYAQANTKSK